MRSDTIAAIATAMGNSGINIIRISGPSAISIAEKIFVSKKNKKISELKSHSMVFGTIMDGDTPVDEVLLSVMRAPNTYTTEDIVEINAHGGNLVTREILELILKNGAVIANPGEFTQRAFLGGRIDLSQAEAVIDLINAKNKYATKSAVSHLKGNISDKIKELRELILDNTAFIETVIDDPEHMSFDGYDEKLNGDLDVLEKDLKKLIDSYDNGKIINEGVDTVIIGKPNAGKSSFLNALLGEERAIVTDIEGTTRDTLVEHLSLDGITLKVTDTAGIRETSDIIEKMGIDKAKEAAKNADLILYLVDSTKKLDDNDKLILNMLKEFENKVIVLINKIDVSNPEDVRDELKSLECNYPLVNISAIGGIGIDEFSKKVHNMFFNGEINFNDEIYISNERQKNCLQNALNSLYLVRQSISLNMPEDMYTVDLIDAYTELGNVIGESLEDDLADRIFSKFCVGK